MITSDRRRVIQRSIASQAVQLGCQVLALGGTEDHVHLLVWFPPTVAVADLVGRVKGASAYSANAATGDVETFRWQSGYGAFTVSATQLDAVMRYVKHQRHHHDAGRLSAPLEWTG